MRYSFSSTDIVDSFSKIIKNTLKKDFQLNVSLNRMRNAVSNAYGYDHYTDLQQNLLGKEPLLQISDLIEKSESEESLINAITPLFSVSSTEISPKKVLEVTREARIDALKKTDSGYQFKTASEAMISNIINQIEALNVYKNLGDELYINFIGTGEEYFNGPGMDAKLSLCILHGNVHIVNEFQKEIAYGPQGRDRLLSFSTSEEVFLGPDFDSTDFGELLDEGKVLNLESMPICDLFAQINTNTAETKFNPHDVIADFPPSHAKVYFTKLLDSYFSAIDKISEALYQRQPKSYQELAYVLLIWQGAEEWLEDEGYDLDEQTCLEFWISLDAEQGNLSMESCCKENLLRILSFEL